MLGKDALFPILNYATRRKQALFTLLWIIFPHVMRGYLGGSVDEVSNLVSAQLMISGS